MGSSASDLYDEDFYRWTRRQAAELRRAATAGANLPLDWQNLAEEIESLGKSDRRELRSRLRSLIEHLLKLAHAPVEEPSRGWRLSVAHQRGDLGDLLHDSPSLRREARSTLGERYREARFNVVATIPPAGAPHWPPLPDSCPFTLDQILDRDWWPERATS